MNPPGCSALCLLPLPPESSIATDPSALLDVLGIQWPLDDPASLEGILSDGAKLGVACVRLHFQGKVNTDDLLGGIQQAGATFHHVQCFLHKDDEAVHPWTRASTSQLFHRGPGPRMTEEIPFSIYQRKEPDAAVLHGPDDDPPFWPPAAEPARRPRHGRTCVIARDGRVFPCLGMRLPIGDLAKERLAAIVDASEILEDLRGEGSRLKGPCASCAGAPGCNGCRGAAHALTGDHLASDPTCPLNAGRHDQIESLPLSVGPYVPHAPPILLVDTLERIGERTALVAATVTGNHPFVDADGVLEPVAFVEMAAQAVAAVDGFATRGAKDEPNGMLLGVKGFDCGGVARTGDRIDVSVRKAARLSGEGTFGVFEVTLARGDETLATGRITTWSAE